MAVNPPQRPTLETEIRQQGRERTLLLKGEINERTPLDGLSSQVTGADVVAIDTFEIHRVNSVGVREWVNFLRALEKQSRVLLVRCSPAVVAQLNSVFNFRASAVVKSVAAPFYCTQCDVEQLDVIPIPEKLTTSPAELVRGEHNCNKCGSPLEFDDLPDRYFLFLQSAAR